MHQQPMTILDQSDRRLMVQSSLMPQKHHTRYSS